MHNVLRIFEPRLKADVTEVQLSQSMEPQATD